jgi:carbon monoxide dehydrogenase subunit G
MKLENEFSVAAPLDQTWSTLLDIERVASCLPGAKLESESSDGTYRGEMTVKLGPMTLSYKGTARLAEVEEDEHIAVLEARARETRGSGMATAMIRNQLTAGDEGTTVVKVETDLNITGRPAQFGRGIMEDVSSRMLDDFARRLEREIVGGQARAAAAEADGDGDGSVPSATAPATPPPPAAENALDLGSVVMGPLAKRAGIAAAVLAVFAVGLAVLLRGRRRRRGPHLTLSWR